MLAQFSTPKSWFKYRSENKLGRTGFVPTMGALHSGHISLIKKSLVENDVTVVSIFVNKTQFNQEGDFEKYPSTLEQDKILIESICGAGDNVILFAPDFDLMYPDSYNYKVSESIDSKFLCGVNRPGHFDGVLTIVLKLLNIVGATKAYFGEKDYQQLELIRGMCNAFFIDTEIIACEIVRDEDGLALSSRNKLLTPEQLIKAKDINKIIDSEKETTKIASALVQEGFDVDYVEEWKGRLFVAASLGDVRLIDNKEIL
jgi:pantoate--beta-alanine ligase